MNEVVHVIAAKRSESTRFNRLNQNDFSFNFPSLDFVWFIEIGNAF